MLPISTSVCLLIIIIMHIYIYTYSCNTYEIKSLAHQVEKVLCFLYRSPQRLSLKDCTCTITPLSSCYSAFSLSTSKQQLDYLFGLLFEQLFMKSPSPQSFHFCPMMSLSINLKVKLYIIFFVYINLTVVLLGEIVVCTYQFGFC